MWQTWLGIVLTAINLFCAAIYVFAPRRHHHKFNAWSEWVLDQNAWEAQGVRYHYCRDCKAVERQAAGLHHCSRRPLKDCNHLQHLNESDITRMEKELGLGG